MKTDVTPFGYEIEKLRFERDLTLEEMAQALNISVSYLHAIIHGNRDIPADFIKKMREKIPLDDLETKQFQKAYENTPQLKKVEPEVLKAAMINMANNICKSQQELESMIKKINEIFDPLNK